MRFHGYPLSLAMTCTALMGFSGWQHELAEAASPDVVGKWEGPFCLPLVSIHVVHLHTGELLMWDDSNGSEKLLDLDMVDCITQQVPDDEGVCLQTLGICRVCHFLSLRSRRM